MAGAGRPGGMGGGQGKAPAQISGNLSSDSAKPGVIGVSLPHMMTGKPSPKNGNGENVDYRFRFYTENTTLLVTSLVDFSRANSLRMNILNVRPPSLEDAFVRLTEEKSHAE